MRLICVNLAQIGRCAQFNCHTLGLGTMVEAIDTDVVVIGAGVIGLAIARNVARRGRDVTVLEAEPFIAAHTSSRNSEVIHAGHYYATGSLKAKLCVAGRQALYAYLETHGIAHKRCGKLVVAIGADEAEALPALHARAHANGVPEINLIDGKAARRLEPALSAEVRCALHSPVTGIFDSHGYMLALQGELEDAGGRVALKAPLIDGQVTPRAVRLHVGGAEPVELAARCVINAAGHNAVAVAAAIEGPHTAHLPRPRYVKGSYFAIQGRTPFSHLIYPMPGTASLGLHLTVDLAGRGKLGPDAEWLPEETRPPFDYAVEPARAARFYDAARRYWPGLPDGALSPDYAGVRPKLVGPGEPPGDFRIEGPGDHGAAGLIHLFGIESPGLTASLAIAAHVTDMAGAQ